MSGNSEPTTARPTNPTLAPSSQRNHAGREKPERDVTRDVYHRLCAFDGGDRSDLSAGGVTVSSDGGRVVTTGQTRDAGERVAEAAVDDPGVEAGVVERAREV